MDGTLVDSEMCASQALCDVWPELPMTALEMNNDYRGMRFAAKLDVLSARYGIPIPEGTEQRLRDREVVLGETMISLNPGVRMVLDKLVAQRINFCIASNAPKVKTLRNAKRCGIDGYFEHREVYSAHDMKAWKPDPTMFLQAAKVEGVNPRDCLVVEDSETGIKAGLAAGMQVFFYDAHDTGTEHSLVESGSDFRDVLHQLEAIA